MRSLTLASFCLLTACGPAQFQQEKLNDGSFKVTCELSMDECVRRAGDLCQNQRYRILEGTSETRLRDAPVPNIPAAMTRALLRLPVTAPYTLTDMALDAAAVLDAAQVTQAHVVGVSMGGMIAQVLAALLPQRVLSLTSIMSSSGNPHPRMALGKRRALAALLRPPPADPADIDAVVDHLLFVFGVIGSPGSDACSRTGS